MKTYFKHKNGGDLLILESVGSRGTHVVKNTVTDEYDEDVLISDLVEVKPTIADILHIAADRYLMIDMNDNRMSVCAYSCDAISEALYYTVGWNTDLKCRIAEGLRNMGLNTTSITAFNNVERKDRQQARYSWLKFAAAIAEEQGV